MTHVELFRVRVALIQAFLEDRNLDGVLLSRSDNVAMATGGRRNYIWIAADNGVFSLFVQRDGRVWYIGNNIESARAFEEELPGLNCDECRYLWFDSSPAEAVRKNFTGNLASDDGTLGENVNGALSYVRALLTPDELEKYRMLGAIAAEAMLATLQDITPGMAEADIAARLVYEGRKRRCIVPVALVAADDRIARYRHPLPTEARLLGNGLEERTVRGYVMVVGCFLREGLVASMTRFKRVGDLPAGVQDRYDRICAVDALMQEATAAGNTLGDVFSVCQKSYADMGFPANEWHNHHQGGATGYAGRTCKGTPGEKFPILDTARWIKAVKDHAGIDTTFGHAYAWNPSGAGVKSEDTFVLNPDGRKEIVTATPSLPQVDLARVLARPTDVVKSGIAE